MHPNIVNSANSIYLWIVINACRRHDHELLMFCGNWVRQSDSFNHIPWWHNCCTTGVTCMYLPKTTHFTYDRDLIASLQTSSGTIILESCHGICHRWYAVSWFKAWGCTRSTCISVLQYACLSVRGTVMKLSTRFLICVICMYNIAKWHPNCTLTSQEKLYILTCSDLPLSDSDHQDDDWVPVHLPLQTLRLNLFQIEWTSMTLCIYDIVRLGDTPGGSIELEVHLIIWRVMG